MQQFYTEPLYEVPAFLGKKNLTGSISNTQDYYGFVFATLGGDGRVDVESISAVVPNLERFIQRYFNSIGSCTSPKSMIASFPPAVYFNKGDLGIGREMHCAYNDCTQETACYVKNYGTLDDNGLGKPHFSDDKAPSKQAFDAHRPFATVAMVSRGQMFGPNKVFFSYSASYVGYLLSNTNNWSGKRDSNSRPQPWQG